MSKILENSYCGLNLESSAWLFEVAEEFASNAILDGFDISTAQFPAEKDLPANISLKILDIGSGDLPESVIGKYDLVHIRLFAFAILNDDPTPILKNLVRMLSMWTYLSIHLPRCIVLGAFGSCSALTQI